MTHQTDDQEKLLLDEGDFQIDVGHHREGNNHAQVQQVHLASRHLSNLKENVKFGLVS
jgi:hypothetical protein